RGCQKGKAWTTGPYFSMISVTAFLMAGWFLGISLSVRYLMAPSVPLCFSSFARKIMREVLLYSVDESRKLCRTLGSYAEAVSFVLVRGFWKRSGRGTS